MAKQISVGTHKAGIHTHLTVRSGVPGAGALLGKLVADDEAIKLGADALDAVVDALVDRILDDDGLRVGFFTGEDDPDAVHKHKHVWSEFVETTRTAARTLAREKVLEAFNAHDLTNGRRLQLIPVIRDPITKPSTLGINLDDDK